MVDHLDRAAGGAAQLLRLIGEAGIGKTRLVGIFRVNAKSKRHKAATA
jgi:predicted ATPase